MECFKLRVQVLLLVCLISISVEANTSFAVDTHVAELNGIPPDSDMGFVESNALVLESISSCDHLIVDRQLADSKSVAVNEQFPFLWFSVYVEVDDCITQVIVSLFERKLEVIFDI